LDIYTMDAADVNPQDANGNASFSFDFASTVPVSWRVTATATPATATGPGGTSEFSRARIVVRPPIE
jgi:uncharacterized protein YfaS (alpha-2-macroglobulin family)